VRLLVVVSNRTADPRKPAAGGLAVAVRESLQQTGRLWFGWSGRVAHEAVADPADQDQLHFQSAGEVMLATLDLSQEDHDAYYLGYANGVL
jgi:trehalose 6-phosphate synthase